MILFPSLTEAIFVRRVNRFIAEVTIDGVPATAHVANTGRMAELLVAGARCYLRPAQNPARKTAWDLFLIEAATGLVCLRAVFANDMVADWLREGHLPHFGQLSSIRREVTIAGHRYDFYLESDRGPWILEVKSVNYITDGVARFPDAPTARGAAHARGLIEARRAGAQVAMLFVSMGRPIDRFVFNRAHDPVFADVMQEARAAGMPLMVIASEMSREGARFSRLVAIDWEGS